MIFHTWNKDIKLYIARCCSDWRWECAFPPEYLERVFPQSLGVGTKEIYGNIANNDRAFKVMCTKYEWMYIYIYLQYVLRSLTYYTSATMSAWAGGFGRHLSLLMVSTHRADTGVPLSEVGIVFQIVLKSSSSHDVPWSVGVPCLSSVGSKASPTKIGSNLWRVPNYRDTRTQET